MASQHPKKHPIHDSMAEIIVDLFAGGGGVSTGIERALGYPPHVAVNHSDNAVSMHRVNHPFTRHYKADVFEVCPRSVVKFMGGRPVGALHLSPDCTHHSQARGGQPRDRKIRALPNVALSWAGQVRPRLITLENVKQILKWGPLIAKRDKATGRVVTLDMVKCQKTGKMVNRVADPGERVPLQQQFLVPDPKREGKHWRRYVRILESMGYEVQYRVRVAADRGEATTRERLYMVARCDGRPIVWNEPAFAKNPKPGQKPWRQAADCIDWSIPCPSIFSRKKPLADATLKRIAKGMMKYVLNSSDPFIVPIANYNGSETVHTTGEPLRTITAWPRGGTFSVVDPLIVPATHQGADRVRSGQEPLATITTAHRGELMAVAPTAVQAAHISTFRSNSDGQSLTDPLATVTAGGKPKRASTGNPFALSAATLVHAGHGEGSPENPRRSHGVKDLNDPLGTIVASGGGHALAAATLIQTGYGERDGQAPRALDLSQPLGTVVAGGGKHALSSAYLMQANGGFNSTVGHDARDPMSTITNSGSQQQVITAFLSSYYTDQSDRCRSPEEPVATVTTANRVGVVAANLVTNTTGHNDASMNEPVPTLTTGGHQALMEYTLSPEHEAGALRVAAFLMQYYSEGGQWSDLRDPMNTITTRDRLALVTVVVKGTPYVIVDIGLRMLKPRELYNAQGFPPDYIIEYGHDGRRFTLDQQVHMCGNSVPPGEIEDIYRANLSELALRSAA